MNGGSGQGQPRGDGGRRDRPRSASSGGKSSARPRGAVPERGRGRTQPRDERSRGRDGRTAPRSAQERSEEQARYDGPPLPEEITGRELDRSVAEQLRGLPDKLASRVARHLVAAGALLEEDPETAYQHALAARARAARVAVVREAVGETAYAAGHFAEALAELRAAKRMNGSIDYLPAMADCERALGRPERALALAKEPAVAKLSTEQQIEMTIVEAGARADMGEVEGALRTLERAPVRSVARADWVVRLRYAYADMLLKAGRPEDALEWFHRTAGIDGNEVTDAAQRVRELEDKGVGEPDADR